MRGAFITLAVAFLLAGCATSPVSSDKAAPVPAERVLHKNASGSDAARVVVTRDSGLLGSGCFLGVFLDGQIAARIAPGETVAMIVAPGEHLLGLGNDPHGRGLCAIEGLAIREIQTVTKPGQVRRYRIAGDMSSGPTLSPTSY